MSRYSFEHDGEAWWVGYDVQDATYFLDRDADLDRDDYLPATMSTFDQLLDRASVPIPEPVLSQLRGEDPTNPLAAEAAAIHRVDQVSAAVRASFPTAALPAPSGPQAGTSGEGRPARRGLDDQRGIER